MRGINTHKNCRMYFHYIYKTLININFLIKVTVNYHVIDFYVNFYLINNVTVFTFCSEFYYMQNNSLFCPLWLGGIKIQPTFALVGVVRGDYPWDINCPIPPAYCMLGLLTCSVAYEFGQLGTGLSWFR